MIGGSDNQKFDLSIKVSIQKRYNCQFRPSFLQVLQRKLFHAKQRAVTAPAEKSSRLIDERTESNGEASVRLSNYLAGNATGATKRRGNFWNAYIYTVVIVFRRLDG